MSKELIQFKVCSSCGDKKVYMGEDRCPTCGGNVFTCDQLKTRKKKEAKK